MVCCADFRSFFQHDLEIFNGGPDSSGFSIVRKQEGSLPESAGCQFITMEFIANGRVR
jgi:hypothetical protein